MKRALSAFLLILMLGSARAEPSSAGALEVEGSLQVPTGASIEAAGLGLQLLNPEGVTEVLADFVLTAPDAIVHVYEQRQVWVADRGPRISEHGVSFPLTNLSLDLRLNRGSGIAAFSFEVPEDEPSRVAATTLGTATIRSVEGAAETERFVTTRDQYTYGSIRTDHLTVASLASIDISGTARLFVRGYHVTLFAQENVTTYETGREDPPEIGGMVSPVGLSRLRYVELELPRFQASFVSDAPVLLAMLQAEVESPRGFACRTASGSLRLSGGDVEADRSSLIVHEPVRFIARAGDDGRSLLEFAVTASTEVPLFESRNARAIGATLGGAAIVSAAGLAAWRRRLPASERYAQRADKAAERGDCETALRWTRKAIAHAPTSGILRENEGFFLSSLGRVEAAVAAYSHAAALSSDGRPSLLAARLLLETSGRTSAAAQHASEALGKSPFLARELLEDPLFEILLSHDDMARRVDIALEKIAAIESRQSRLGRSTAKA